MSGCRCNETREKKRCAQENIEIINELRISDTNPNSVVEKDLSPNVSTRLYETRELKEVEELLKSSGGISQINVQDVKPLQLAVAQGTSFELVKWLIEHGSDVNMCFGFRRTPFHLALKRGKNAVEEKEMD
nr:uncharacterized protein LOC106688217 [Halyomorpha halys]